MPFAVSHLLSYWGGRLLNQHDSALAGSGRHSEQPERDFSGGGILFYPQAPDPGAQNLHADGIRDIGDLSRLLSHLPFHARRCAVPRARPCAALLFRSAWNSHGAGNGDCAAGAGNAHKGAQRPVRPASGHRTLDAAHLALCLRYRRGRLLDSFPHLWRSLSPTEGLDSARPSG